MRKQFIQKSILFVFIVLLSNTLFAAVTWTGAGANNLWSNSANWDSGTIPNSADDVIIPAGAGVVRFNYSNRRAKSLYINTGSTVRIISGAKLRLITAGVSRAVSNYGTLDVRGTLLIQNATSRGIYNLGTLSNRGLISMKNITYYGLKNEGAVVNLAAGTMQFLNTGGSEDLETHLGTLENEGTIRFLAGSTGRGMVIGDGFVNTTTGSIIFEDGQAGRLLIEGSTPTNDGLIEMINPTYSNYLIYLSGGTTFTNGQSGELIVEGCVGYAGINLVGGAILDNYGSINFSSFSSSTDGILNLYGTVINNANADISMRSVDVGINVGSELENYGDMSFIAMDSYALYVSGELTNFDDAYIGMINAEVGIRVTSSGTFTNDSGELLFSSIIDNDIVNKGNFFNLGCGFVKGDNKIDNDGGVFENDAWLSYLDDADDHVYSGNQIVNTGVVIDPYDRFANALDNQEARVTALVNPQANVAYNNALDIANITSSAIGDFFLDPNHILSAGHYDHATNTYTPNTAAIGATTLYTIIYEDCLKVVTIRVDGGVLPIANEEPSEELMFRESSAKDAALEKLSVFPNPTTGVFQAKIPALEAANYELQLLNAQGQMISRQQGDASFETLVTLDLSDSPAGMYWTRLLVDGKMIAQEKIIRLR